MTDQPASEAFELVIEPAVDRRRWFDRLLRRELEAGMQIFYVRDKATGETFLRHIEPADDAHVHDDVAADLASMSAADFAARWR